MTNEFAIKVLTELRGYGDKFANIGFDRKEALDMAIQVLSQEPCDDAIDRAEAMTEIMMFAGNVKPDEEDIYIKVSDAVQLLRELPSVTQKSGKWIDDEFGSKCSCCGIHTHLDKFDSPMKFKYCSMCGAKMESEEKE